jgi:predicted RNase H-like HicB family nuclease
MQPPSVNEIRIEYDEASRGYYIIWQPQVVIAMGRTAAEALEDLREAAHFGIDTAVDLQVAPGD